MTTMQQAQQQDNTNTGAVFPTEDPMVFNGPMNYFGNSRRAEFKKIKDKNKQDRYMLTVLEGTNKVVAQAVLTRIENEAALKVPKNSEERRTMHQPPRFKGSLKPQEAKSGKNLPVALWLAYNEDHDTGYLQIRPDSQFTARGIEDLQTL